MSHPRRHDSERHWTILCLTFSNTSPDHPFCFGMRPVTELREHDEKRGSYLISLLIIQNRFILLCFTLPYHHTGKPQKRVRGGGDREEIELAMHDSSRSKLPLLPPHHHLLLHLRHHLPHQLVVTKQ
jgi:hypothetical protein